MKPHTQELGRRVELLSMDPHCHDISVALYRRDVGDRPEYLVHSYASVDGTTERLAFLRRTLAKLANLNSAGNWLYFSCGDGHQLAARRAFVESCKVGSNQELTPRSLRVLDKRTGLTIIAESLGHGQYRIVAEGPDEGKAAKADSIAAGLCKLGHLSPVDCHSNEVAFPCLQPHDELIALLLPRALNIRKTLLEEEATARRGLLVAPSQQK